MKKEYLLMSLLGVIGFTSFAYTAPRSDFQVSKDYTNNGDTRSGFTVLVASTAWAEILPRDIERRLAVIHSTSTSVVEICLSTISASATTCSDTTNASRFPYVGTSIEDHNEAPLYGRVIAGNGGTARLYGQIQYDSGD